MAAYYGLFLTIHILCAITFIGVVSLFFEVRLLPAHWIALGAMLIGLWMQELIPVMALLFTLIGLLEVWFALRKRSLRPVTDSNLS